MHTEQITRISGFNQMVCPALEMAALAQSLFSWSLPDARVWILDGQDKHSQTAVKAQTSKAELCSTPPTLSESHVMPTGQPHYS